MPADDKKISIAVPGEWMLQKVLGPVLSEMGEDLKKVYAKGRDKISSRAYGKIPDPDDGKQANLRVARDVFWNGSFSDDEVCAEYFGGMLASSRSGDGKDDSAIQFVDVCKSLSSRQLRLHYVIYNSLNKLMVASGKQVNILSNEIRSTHVYFSGVELMMLKIDVMLDTTVLLRQDLLSGWKSEIKMGDLLLPHLLINPTTFGVMLYAAAHNRLSKFNSFHKVDFGDFDNVALPKHYASTLPELVQSHPPLDDLVRGDQPPPNA